jgi:hypothetical protein
MENENTTCSLCYKPIAAHGTWVHGHNALPLACDNRHESLVNHNRCCDECNNLVLLVRIAQACGNPQTVEPIVRGFAEAKNQTEVILAHMNAYTHFDVERVKRMFGGDY